MTAATPAVQIRGNVYFSPSGTYGACLAHPVTGETVLERWHFGAAAATRTPLGTGPPVPARCQLAPLDDGRILLLRLGSERQEAALIGPDGVEVTLGTVTGDMVRLIAAPGAGTLGYLLVPCTGGTRLRAVGDRPDGIRDRGPVIPGSVGTTAWLDTAGHALGFTHLHGGRTRVSVVDPTSDGSPAVRTLPFPGDDPTHLLLAAPGSGGVLLARGGPGGLRFSWSTVDGSAVRDPEPLARLDGMVLPLAIAPDGSGVAFSVTRGTASRLVIWSPATDAVRPVDLGTAGRITGIGAWDATGFRAPFSTPDRPTGFVEVRSTVTLHPPRQRRWHPAGTEWFDGPAGAIEAVTYRDWRRADHVVIALHGGPEAAWQLGFEPLFQYLAAAGVAVVAPNQRGSVGYGDAHRAAIRHAWGGPDLDDVVHLAGEVAHRRGAARRTPALLGTSYGAFLAAARAPHLVGRCVAVAPFISAERLYADAAAPVRRMIDRLGGRTVGVDPPGHHDLERLAPRLAVPLLLVHGTDDPIVPVIHSRRIARAAGQALLEISGAGHDPFFGPHAPLALVRVTGFLRADTHRVTPDAVPLRHAHEGGETDDRDRHRGPAVAAGRE